MAFNPQQHWEEIYRTRDESALSWFEDRPEATLDTILPLVPDRNAPIVEVGGGTSRVVDLLLNHGYTNLTVLDIAEPALELSRSRLAGHAGEVTWVHASVLEWQPASPVRLWHDRAVFHFFSGQPERQTYARCAARAVESGGFAVLEVFAPDGPKSCSGLPVYRATPEDIAAEFSPAFRLHSSARHTHTTPTASTQNFQTIVLERIQP